MLAREFLAQVDTMPPPALVLFAPGKAPFNKEAWEPYLADAGLNGLVRRFVEPGMEDLSYSVFHADEVPPGEVVAEAQTMAFLAERRVIVVRNAGRYSDMSADKKSPLAPLLDYLASPNEATILILVADKMDKRKKFYTAFSKAGLVVECPQLEDRELKQWILEAAAKEGKKISAPAAELLIERGGSRLADIANALKLVANFVGGEEAIREEDIIAATADVAEDSVWDLTDAIANSNTTKALTTLQQLIELGKYPDEILGTINWLLESAYKAAPQSSAPKPSPFVSNKVAPLIKKFGFEKLKDALILCTDTQFALRNTGVDKNLTLEMLVIKLAYRPTKASRRA